MFLTRHSASRRRPVVAPGDRGTRCWRPPRMRVRIILCEFTLLRAGRSRPSLRRRRNSGCLVGGRRGTKVIFSHIYPHPLCRPFPAVEAICVCARAGIRRRRARVGQQIPRPVANACRLLRGNCHKWLQALRGGLPRLLVQRRIEPRSSASGCGSETDVYLRSDYLTIPIPGD